MAPERRCTVESERARMSGAPRPDVSPSDEGWLDVRWTAGHDVESDVWVPVEFDDRAWRRSAACRDADPAMFFPVGTTGAAVGEIVEAKAVCNRCPVRLACLRFALVTHQEFGVWGGKDEEDRRELRRQWKRLGRPFPVVRGLHFDRGADQPATDPFDRAG